MVVVSGTVSFLLFQFFFPEIKKNFLVFYICQENNIQVLKKSLLFAEMLRGNPINNESVVASIEQLIGFYHIAVEYFNFVRSLRTC